MNVDLSRRSFLKLSGAGAASVRPEFLQRLRANCNGFATILRAGGSRQALQMGGIGPFPA